MKKVLILGGSGMLGHALFAHLSTQKALTVYATTRTAYGLTPWFPASYTNKVREGVDADKFDTVLDTITDIQPDIVLNCIGLIKQVKTADDPLSAKTINSQFPHQVSKICQTTGAKMIHFSTDCVFDGKKGGYKEDDPSNADDLYGQSKFLGEVDFPHCVTLRTSIIGHELRGLHGLIEWFLSQEGFVRGFTNAIYSGFPTIELAHIICEIVISNPDLQGVYHVSSSPISKYELLKLVAEKYGKHIIIEPYSDYFVDRSLDSSKFQKTTQYCPPTWPELVDKMFQNFISAPYYKNRVYK